MDVTELPNVGPKLADNLRRVGLETPKATACFHQLTALAGAELGIPKKAIPQEKKAELRAFLTACKQIGETDVQAA